MVEVASLAPQTKLAKLLGECLELYAESAQRFFIGSETASEYGECSEVEARGENISKSVGKDQQVSGTGNQVLRK